jgi:DnaJ-class molecular chaperone
MSRNEGRVYPIMYGHWAACDDGYDELDECLVCGGTGYMDNDDPMWNGFVDEIPCNSCGGSGLKNDMTWC